MRVFDDFTLDWYRGIYGYTGTKEIHFSPDGHALINGSHEPSESGPGTQSCWLDRYRERIPSTWGMQYGGADGDKGDGHGDRSLMGTSSIRRHAGRSIFFPSMDFYYVKTDLPSAMSGCNEAAIDIQAHSRYASSKRSLNLNRFLVHEIPQVEAGMGFLRTTRKQDICDDPEPLRLCRSAVRHDCLVDTRRDGRSRGSQSRLQDSMVRTSTTRFRLAAMVDYGLLFDGVDDLRRGTQWSYRERACSTGRWSAEFRSLHDRCLDQDRRQCDPGLGSDHGEAKHRTVARAMRSS